MPQGPTIVGAGADLADGLNPWANPGNITAQDGAFATASTPAGPTNTLRATMAASAFSATSAVVGVQVDIRCEQPIGGATVLSFARLTQGGAAIGTNQATNNAVPTTLGNVSIGGSTSTWGNGGSIASATANSSTFGVDLQFSGGAADSISVDDVALTIWFTAGTESSELIASRICISG